MSRSFSSSAFAAFASAAIVASLSPSPNAWAETLVLESGGRIEGEIVNDKESPRQTYIVKTSSGARVTLARSQVKEVIHQTDAELEYEKIRPQYPDTVEGQWDLALWCRDKGLASLRDKHLERIIELDPEHKEAHRLLNHTWDHGRWKSKNEFWEDQGYVNYKGDWMTPQEVELKERARKNELAVKEWKHKLKMWRGWMNTDRSQEAIANIDQINDPYAVGALAEYVVDETNEAIRKRYIEAMARIGTAAAWRVLVEISLHDNNEEVRLTCLDYLDDRPSPDAINYYIRSLQHKDNKVVNRAAIGLLRLRARHAVGALIEALITKHKHVIKSDGNTTSTFSSGGGGFSFGSSPPKIVDVPYQNQDVLDALVHLAGGVNFNFNIPGWKAWYAMQKKAQSLNGRRD